MKEISLHRQLFTVDDWHELPEGHLELLDGCIRLGGDGEMLLKALLVNNGLIEVVRHAPPALWKEAIRSVYGEDSIAT